jgi:hypothetical protein
MHARFTYDQRGIEVRAASPHNRGMFLKSAALGLLKLTIVVYNWQSVSPEQLQRGQTLAAAIFRDAGVEVRWRPATASDLDLRLNEIPVHLLTGRPAALGTDTGGYAVLMGDRSYAGVSLAAVTQTTGPLDADPGILLGAMLAHELGHVLLRSSDHSANGVMVVRLAAHEIQAAARGELRFSRAEAQRIRAEILRRATLGQ